LREVFFAAVRSSCAAFNARPAAGSIRADSKNKAEANRCLKRYIAREVYNALPKSAPT